MTVAAIIPYKGDDTAKTRLGLPARVRLDVANTLLQRALTALLEAPSVGMVAVVAPKGTPVASGAAHIVPDSLGHNRAVREGISWALDQGAGSAIVIPADLPFVSPQDIEALIVRLRRPNTAVIAPSKDGGTSGLGLRHPNLINPLYGPDSAWRHAQAVRAAGGGVSWLWRKGLVFDVDVPEDLAFLTGQDFHILAG